ncbi:MAG: undecaprenyldiphospho-muramoylpentapeptide beta-N-acetylglucosaminyltransferase [Candidatus Omnitrophica bacterium]|nr:undecaprenyldiphospho-muramoylpentapeptide beta-N-acetylglucosaminyltransferase [Candidatus Omnitrophota bacterium]
MKVLISCGGTGGHILPALRLYEELSIYGEDMEILLVSGQRKIEKKIVTKGYKIIVLDASPLRIFPVKEFFLSGFRLFKTTLKSLFILVRFKPEVVVGFGGYASFFIVLFASLLRIKTIIHEENVLMGRANRLLAIFVDNISLGFEKTKLLFPHYKNKMVVTGNPIRRSFQRIEKKEALGYFGFLPDCFTILVTGGSQGSRHINREFLNTVFLLKDRIKFQVIHLCGDKDYEFLNKEYNRIEIPTRVFSFLDSMEYALSSADLIVCRAGAMTISELIFFEIPAIVIPYPYAYQHQLYNALILKDAGCAVILKDKELNSLRLKEIILELVQNPEKLEKMRSDYYKLKRTGTIKLWDLVLSFN